MAGIDVATRSPLRSPRLSPGHPVRGRTQRGEA
jgi:hypothetical protein